MKRTEWAGLHLFRFISIRRWKESVSMATSIVVKHHFKYTVVLPNDAMVTVAVK